MYAKRPSRGDGLMMTITELIMNFGIGIDTDDNDICSCGKVHRADIKEIIIQEGALSIVPSLVKKHGGLKAFIIADKNTFMAAGETLCEKLK